MKTKKLARNKVGKYTISTIHIEYARMPSHYETMVFFKVGKFTGGLGTEVHQSVWTTEQEAVQGHEELVQRLKDGWKP